MLKRIANSLAYRTHYWGGHAARTARVLSHAIAALPRTQKQKGLFIDCGSNLGQGFTYFSRFYQPARYDYVLVEPNPNCLPTLQKVIARRAAGTRSELIAMAASDKDGTVTFYGLAEGEGGKTSEGGSIDPAHNSKYYKPSKEGSITVPTFALADLILEKAKSYSHIVLKLDVEGAEYGIIPHLIQTGALGKLGHLYVEFHAEYASGNEIAARRAQEAEFVKQFNQLGVAHTLWI